MLNLFSLESTPQFRKSDPGLPVATYSQILFDAWLVNEFGCSVGYSVPSIDRMKSFIVPRRMVIRFLRQFSNLSLTFSKHDFILFVMLSDNPFASTF